MFTKLPTNEDQADHHILYEQKKSNAFPVFNPTSKPFPLTVWRTSYFGRPAHCMYALTNSGVMGYSASRWDHPSDPEVTTSQN